MQAYIDNNTSIITDPNIAFANKPLLFKDDIEMNRLLTEKTRPTRNQSFVAIVCFSMLYYARNKYSNILQRVNGQFAFTNNIPKKFIKAFYQMGIIVSYESICHGLNINAKVVMDTIVEKIQTCQFFVFYNNMNVYEHARN